MSDHPSNEVGAMLEAWTVTITLTSPREWIKWGHITSEGYPEEDEHWHVLISVIDQRGFQQTRAVSRWSPCTTRGTCEPGLGTAVTKSAPRANLHCNQMEWFLRISDWAPPKHIELSASECYSIWVLYSRECYIAEKSYCIVTEAKG